MKTAFACLLLLMVSAAWAADEKPAVPSPSTTTFRITGLFAPDREADLRATLEEIPGIQLKSLDFEHAEGAFEFDAATVFKGVKPDDIVKKFDEKIRGASNATFGIQPVSTTPHAQLKRIEIPIVGLDCRACCLAAYESISKIDGVTQATASFKEGRLTALIDPSKTNPTALEEALKKRNVTLAKP
jgi:hypothetical protein